MTELAAFLPDHVVDELFRPTGEALGLPGNLYGDAFFALERDRIFTRRWVVVAVGANLPEPGSVYPVELAGRPLLLVRGNDGVIRCFHNICRHRAMKLVAEPCQGLRALHCPWHGWTYDLDGRLQGTPNIGGDYINTDTAFPAEGIKLVEINCAQWLDFVFVNLDGNAPDFGRYIEPLDKRLADYGLNELRYAESVPSSFVGNWKVFVEGAIENYHVPFAHPQLASGERSVQWRHEALGDCALAMSYVPEIFNKLGEGGSALRQSDLPRCSSTPAESRRNFLINLFPTGLFILNDIHCVQGVITPNAAESTDVLRNLYFFADGATASRHTEGRRAVCRGWDEVAVQDQVLVREVQSLSKARDAAGIRTRFSPYWEASVHNFQKLLVGAMQGAGN